VEFEPAGGGHFRGAGEERELEIAFEGGRAKEPRHLIFKARRGAPQIFEATAPLSLSARQLGAYAGKYWSDEMQVTYALSPEGGRLVLVVPNLPKLLLVPTARDIFAAEALTLRFDRDAAARVKGFRFGAGRIRNVGFVRAAR